MPETDRHQLACIRPIFTPKGIKVEIAEIQRFVDQFISTIRDIVDSLATEFGNPRAD